MTSIDVVVAAAKRQRGYLIVVEGLDRAGKTTQCESLCEDIRGVAGEDSEVKYQKFPGTGALLSFGP